MPGSLCGRRHVFAENGLCKIPLNEGLLAGWNSLCAGLPLAVRGSADPCCGGSPDPCCGGSPDPCCARVSRPLLCAGLPTPAVRGSPDPCCARVSRPLLWRVSRPLLCAGLPTPAVRGSPDPARRLTEGLAVRGSPDPARPLTEGLQGQRLALIRGDLRSHPRRGRETRAEHGHTHGGVGRPAERFVKRYCALVAIIFWFVRPVYRHADIVRLDRCQLCELDA